MKSSLDDIRAEADGQLLLEGLHDSRLFGVHRVGPGVLQLMLVSVTGDQRRLTITMEGEACVYGLGLVLPLIVSALYLNPPAEAWTQLIGAQAKEEFDLKRREYGGSEGWTLVIHAVYGDGLIIFGPGQLSQIGWAD